MNPHDTPLKIHISSVISDPNQPISMPQGAQVGQQLQLRRCQVRRDGSGILWDWKWGLGARCVEQTLEKKVELRQNLKNTWKYG